MTIGALLTAAAQQLSAAGVDPVRLTAEVLLAHNLGRDRAYLFAHSHDDIAPAPEYQRLLERRASGVPTQYLTGRQEFYGRDFAVGPGVLIPRPETEHVVEHALALVPAPTGAILDLCTGSGIIGITLALECGRRVILSDISRDALAYAQRNAERLAPACQIAQADLLTAFAPQSIDLIVSNPPYIASTDELPREVAEHEPALALFAGESGNDFYARVFADAPRVLRPVGRVVLELGWQSAAAVTRLAAANGFTDIQVHQDLGNRDRVLTCRLKG